MQYNVVSEKFNAELNSECLVLGLYSNKTFSQELAAFDATVAQAVTQVIDLEELTGKVGEVTVLRAVHKQVARVVVVGLGDQAGISLKDATKVCKTVFSTVQACKAKTVDVAFSLNVTGYAAGYFARVLVETAENIFYVFDEYKTKKTTHTLTTVNVHTEAPQAFHFLAEGKAVACGVAVAKNLGNAPANVCVPKYLADLAYTYADNAHTTVTIVDEDEMRRLGMGAYLAVSAGSVHNAYLSIIDYNNAPDKNTKPIVLVGKGLTFDAGGVSLKPGAAMDEMKYDMCGAASVFGTLKAVQELNLPIHVIGVAAGCENMVGSTAYKPGDILTSLAKKTIEVLNTDAEGRLVLCDSLEYVKRFDPEVIVDMATLTGACMVALGNHLSAVYSNDQTLLKELLQSGEKSGDRAWSMPLDEDYAAQLKSTVADISNLGGRFGGSITAAEFLHFFVTDDYKWAHFDIAGTAWVSGAHKGGTGRPVSLLTQFLIDHQ